MVIQTVKKQRLLRNVEFHYGAAQEFSDVGIWLSEIFSFLWSSYIVLALTMYGATALLPSSGKCKHLIRWTAVTKTISF
jgi:hypothetical protein